MVGARRIYVFDRQGRSLLDTEPGVPVGREYARLRIDRAEMDAVWRGRPALSPLFQDADGAYYQSGYAPVFAEADPVAGVGVDLGAAFLETIRAFGRSVLALGIAGAALTVGLGLGMARTITGPVRRLASAAREIGSGNLERPVAVSSRDEIGILAETMEEMRRGILIRDARLRQMLAGVAHEIRNPLGGIELYAGLIADDLPDADPRKAHIRKVIGEVRNLNRIISEFLDFARPGHPHPASTPVSDLVEGAAFPLRPEMEDAGVAYRQDVPEDLQARVDPEPVKRALLNLMKNALQAMPGGGNLTVRARVEGSRVQIEVQDDGPGIPPEARERIFEPFYTTKPQGSGLGLAIARKIAEENGGRLEVESETGMGTTFRVTLPREPT
jgi:signal transduction histidine kinase